MKQTFKIVYATSMVEPTTLKRTRYTSRKRAQNAADKLNARSERAGFMHRFAVYSLEEYEEAVRGKGEWKTSVCGGQKVWVPLGTPACCDPSTETYWSM
jgi:hypothetical protein